MTQNDKQEFLKKAKDFMDSMPYKIEPYSSRNWGHPWHSLCSYHGKLKPAIAYFLIKYFTNKWDTVLDPLCWVWTIPFEACLQWRIWIGNDLSEMAYVISKAKLEKANIEDVNRIIWDIEKYISKNKDTKRIEDLINENKDFWFNWKLESYFHPDTFKEIITLRDYFLKKLIITPEDAVVYSSFLHILHWNRPYALSRCSHPLTPYAPKGEFEYKNVVEHIKDKINITYNKWEFTNYVHWKAIYWDFNDISWIDNSVDFIISSPPFAWSIKFYMQNRMRLRLCWWTPEDFKKADQKFLDSKQKKDFSIYKDFFFMCNRVLKENWKVILHLWKTNKYDMAEELSKYCLDYFDVVYSWTESVQEIEKHGIRDKWWVTEHQYLFLMKK